MKYLIFSLPFLVFSALAAAAPAAPPAQQVKRALEVLNKFVSPAQLKTLSPEALKKSMSAVTYQELNPRDILRITSDQKIKFRNPKDFLDRAEGFISESGSGELKSGEIIRVVQRFENKSLQYDTKANFSGVQAEYVEVLEFSVVKLDADFKPTGEIFYLNAQNNLNGKVSAERFNGGFMSRTSSLRLSRAGLGDIVMNAQDYDSQHGVIPAFTAAIITHIAGKRIPWTISNYDYVATLYLLNCPAQFRKTNCYVQIKGTKAWADPTWAHYTMPENRREKHFWGMTLVY